MVIQSIVQKVEMELSDKVDSIFESQGGIGLSQMDVVTEAIELIRFAKECGERLDIKAIRDLIEQL
jgi:molybdopterin biosynthesis enzyme MoaB